MVMEEGVSSGWLRHEAEDDVIRLQWPPLLHTKQNKIFLGYDLSDALNENGLFL